MPQPQHTWEHLANGHILVSVNFLRVCQRAQAEQRGSGSSGPNFTSSL